MSVSNLNLSKTNKTSVSTFGEAFYKPGGQCGPRIQPDYQLVLVTQGNATVTINGSRITLDSAHAFLCRPGDHEMFEFERNSNCAHIWLSVSPQELSENIQKRISSQSQSRMTISTIESLIRTGLSAKGDEFINALAIATIEAFLSPEVKLVSDPLTRALDYIRTSIHLPLSMSAISEKSYTSSQHLTRLFRESMGTTPMRFVWQERTRRGIELLNSTGLGVAEISFQLGFQSPYHFSRLVREMSGYCPRELRNNLWSK
jgi:AraC-like DNA-binding protein/quercetin dioxygenase-like cupin family protein